MSIPSVVILIPIYKIPLEPNEVISLNQCCNILGNYPIKFIVPVHLDIQEISAAYPNTEVQTFPDHYFKGTESYNQLLTSIGFYEQFLNYEYLLIYQLDAFVFRDELAYWCNKKWDYIGAPSLHMEEFDNISAEGAVRFSQALNKNRVVLNGGLSLRRIPAILRYLKIYNLFYPKWMGNEDMLFSQEATRLLPMKLFLKTPPWHEALQFSFEKSPEASFIINHKKLPFACHAWERYNVDFWKKHIRE